MHGARESAWNFDVGESERDPWEASARPDGNVAEAVAQGSLVGASECLLQQREDGYSESRARMLLMTACLSYSYVAL